MNELGQTVSRIDAGLIDLVDHPVQLLLPCPAFRRNGKKLMDGIRDDVEVPDPL